MATSTSDGEYSKFINYLGLDIGSVEFDELLNAAKFIDSSKKGIAFSINELENAACVEDLVNLSEAGAVQFTPEMKLITIPKPPNPPPQQVWYLNQAPSTASIGKLVQIEISDGAATEADTEGGSVSSIHSIVYSGQSQANSIGKQFARMHGDSPSIPIEISSDDESPPLNAADEADTEVEVSGDESQMPNEVKSDEAAASADYPPFGHDVDAMPEDSEDRAPSEGDPETWSDPKELRAVKRFPRHVKRAVDYVDPESADESDTKKARITYAINEETPIEETQQRAPLKRIWKGRHGDPNAFTFCKLRRCGGSQGCDKDCKPFRIWMAGDLDTFCDKCVDRQHCDKCLYAIFDKWLSFKQDIPLDKWLEGTSNGLLWTPATDKREKRFY